MLDTTVSPAASSRRARRVSSLLTAAVAAALLGAVSACQSPVQPDAFDRNLGGYADSVLARAIADGSLSGVTPAGLTDNQGVHELKPGETSSEISTIPLGTMPAELPTASEVYQVAATQRAYAATLGLPETQISLSLQEAIARTLAHSLSIRVEAYNPAIKESQITEALAIYDPTFFGNSQWTNQDEPIALSPISVNGVTWQNSVGLRQLLPSGGTASAGVGDTYRSFQNNQLVTPNSSHEANLNVSLSQPLLRGFGSVVTSANIYLAQRDYGISLSQFRKQVIKSVGDVEDAYQSLVAAISAVDIQERLLADTRETYRRILVRVNIDADRVQIKQAEAAVQSRQAELVRALTTVRNASDRLKSLINDPSMDLRGNCLIIPADKPIDVPMSFNVGEQIDLALRQRPELEEARLNIQKTDIIVNVARNDLLPKADITLSAGSNGFDNGFDTSFTETFDAPQYIDYSAGLKFEMPLGNRAAEAALHRRKMERRQAVTQMLQIAQQVILDVKVQLREILTSYREVQARRAARISAGEELNALVAKEDVDKITPEFLRLKLDAQQRRANAELDELNAVINYNQSLAHLEQAKGTLLEYNRIALTRPPESDENGNIRFLGTTFDAWMPAATKHPTPAPATPQPMAPPQSQPQSQPESQPQTQPAF
jgi:outer membrane protein TolC